MNMDKSWMHLDRFRPAYREGVRNFIERARDHADGLGRIRCPCKGCKNREYKLVEDVHDELIYKGIDKSYTCWVHHGENYEVLSDGEEDDDDNSVVGDQVGIRDMLEDLQTGETSNINSLGENETTHEVVQADEVDVNVVLSNRERYQAEDDFIVNEVSDEEDDTLMDYCSEQEDAASSDDDRDID